MLTDINEMKQCGQGALTVYVCTLSKVNLMEYITMCLDSTNELEHWYVRNKLFIVLNHRIYVSTYTHVIFRPSDTGESIKCYACWDPIMLTDIC